MQFFNFKKIQKTKPNSTNLSLIQHPLACIQIGFFAYVSKQVQLPKKFFVPFVSITALGFVADCILYKYGSQPALIKRCFGDKEENFKITKLCFGLWGIILPLHSSSPNTIKSIASSLLLFPIAKDIDFAFVPLLIVGLGYTIPPLNPIFAGFIPALWSISIIGVGVLASTCFKDYKADLARFAIISIPFKFGSNILSYTEKALSDLRNYCKREQDSQAVVAQL